MSIDAPLTFGQLSTWRSIETFAADRLMEVNVPATWDLRGLSTSAALTALDRLVQRHESLRTTFEVVDGTPLQRIHAELPPRIEQVQRSCFDAEDGLRITRELHSRAFPIVGDPGWHGVLASSGNQSLYLALSLSHLVVDLWAVQELEAQFHELAREPSAGPGTAPAPRALAALQLGDAWSTRRRGAEKYWRKVLNSGPVRNLPAAAPESGQRRIQATLRSHRLAVLASAAARQHGVSRQSLLMAVTAAALAQLVEGNRVMLSVMSANRFDEDWQPLISTMNQLIPLVCDVDPASSLARHLKLAHIGALLAYRHGSYDVDRAAELAAEAAGDFEHDCWFNYVDEPPRQLPACDGPEPAAELAWTPPPRQAGHPFYARINGDGESWIAVTLRVNPDLISAEAVVEALRVIATAVLCAVTEPDSTVGSLLSGRPALPSELFPADADCVPSSGR